MGRLFQRLAFGLLAMGLAVASAVAAPRVAKSADGHFVLRVTGIASPEPINHLHGFDLTLASADGKPVDGASITLSGQRLFAPNPLPTLPQVSAAPGSGNYRVEGLRFHMPGDWHLVFDIEFGQIRDRATLDVAVQ